MASATESNPLPQSRSSPVPEQELQLLEMMRNILGVDNSHLAARNQRSSMSYVSSVPCEDSLPVEASADLNIFDEDLDDSEECNDYGCQAKPGPAPLELLPCPHPLVPMDHPCFVRVIVLRTPLLHHDPCKNFSLETSSSSTSSTSTSTTAKPSKARKCRPRLKATMHNTTSTSTTQATTSDESEMETVEAIDSSTTSERSLPSTTTEEPRSTTTEISTTTPAPTSPPTTTTTSTPTPSSSTTIVYSRQSQLKSLKGRRRKQKRPNVADTPQIKLDGAMQSSDTFEVFQTTEVSDLRLRPEATTPACEPEITTRAPVDCAEDTSAVEAIKERASEGETEQRELRLHYNKLHMF